VPATLRAQAGRLLLTRDSTDAVLLAQLLALHFVQPPTVLDASWGRGQLWRGCSYQPTVRLDARPLPGVDVVGSWDELPRLFGPWSFQALVWDPPHMNDGGKQTYADWGDRYGVDGQNVRGRPDVTHLFAPFLVGASVVLGLEGLLLVKMADQVHGGLLHCQAFDLVQALEAAHWTVCGLVPKYRQTMGDDPKWKRRLHVRQSWSYWIAAHPGLRCPASGVELMRTCAAPGCGVTFRPTRSTRQACSARCRQRVHRQGLATSVRPKGDPVTTP